MFTGHSQLLKAQETKVYTDKMRWFSQGLDLYQKEKYSAAIDAFDRAMREIDDHNSEAYVNAVYYKAVCALNLFNRDAEYQLKQFIKHYPESPRVKNAYFQLGKYNYRKKDYEECIYWFSKCDVFDLTVEELNEYNFRMGYSLFQLKQYEEAARYFHELIDIKSPYYAPANYYYAHIAYYEGNYATALARFEKLKDDKKFSLIVPYYITQIYYFQEKYDTLIRYATPLFENKKTRRRAEIAHLIADSYMKKKLYVKAVPYYEFFVKNSDNVTREDYYWLGLAQAESGDCKSAIKQFSKVAIDDDALAQKAIYRLGICYMKEGDKKKAGNAFYKAYKLGYDDEISENSLLNYAKISYETAFDPYSEAIDAFIEYLEKYPDGIRKDEAYSYLVNIYLSTKNYRAALASLEITKSLDPRLRAAYQQIQFNLGIELFQNKQFGQAIKAFEAARDQNENKELGTLSMYWIGESYYRMKRYLAAIDAYKKFIFEPRAFLLKEFKTANYNLGYAYYKTHEYDDAASWFRKFLNYEDIDENMRTDALIRTGDCYFITKKYLLAEEYYKKAYKPGARDADYALYQLALCEGLLNKRSRQNKTLEQLLKTYPRSAYANDARYELGRNYMSKGNYDHALVLFEEIVNTGDHSTARKKALLNIGLIYYNQNKNDKALAYFKQVVSEYPSYRESHQALAQIQNIYRETGDIDAYEAYINSLPFMNITDGAFDSLTYESAELAYLAENCEKAVPAFEKYLEKFDHPIFLNKANFYLAECLYKLNEEERSLQHYEVVLKNLDPLFYDPALKRAAELSYKLKKYGRALAYFKILQNNSKSDEEVLDAHWWALRSAVYLDSNEVIVSEANYILNHTNPDKEKEADVRYYLGKAYLALGQKDDAVREFTRVNKLTQSQKSAEALYIIADIFYDKGQIDTAEKVIYELVNHTPTYDYWLAKGLIKLSDIFVLREDYFQARATLENIVKNYKRDDDIRKTAVEKLDNLTNLENSTFEEPKKDSIETIDFDTDDFIDLFDEEQPVDEQIPNNKKRDNE